MPVGFYFDMTRCTGCRACQVACKDKNRLDVGTVFRYAKTYSVGKFPKVTAYSYSASCNHCAMPACLAACPTAAIYKAEDGTVIIDQDVCIGDASCTKACPYLIPKLLPSGKAGKCDGCYAIRDAGGTPACVAGCPNRALDFGDTEALKKKYGTGTVSELPILPSAATTTPALLIKAKPAASDDGYTELNW
jgi:anaerobic dimethyl sulfoxide reductase subunit B (iron-sulfur subunit)